jgi:two-component system, OmpR family, phosphate regulon sensor histidine kinase PhoR
MTSAHKLLLTASLRVALLAALGGLLGGLVFGWTAAFVMTTLIVFAGFAYHAWKLSQLHIWLGSDLRAADLPDGFGTWGDVLSDLYRVIRQQRTDQQALSNSLARFQQAATALPDGAVMLDNENSIVWCNPAAEEHWHISLSNDRMQTITYIVRTPEFIEFLAKRNLGESLTLKFSQAMGANSSREVSLAVQLVGFGDDQTLLLSRDISERERLERMRSDFVANVSHELRTPLTVMAGFLETMHETDIAGGSKPELLKRSLDHMSQQTERMQRLVDDLLALSRLEDAQNKLAESVIDVQGLVQASVNDARIMSGGRHKITTSLSPMWLMGNRDEVSSLVSNLVSNAIRYTPDGGSVHVSLEIVPAAGHAGGDLLFSVTDTGEGIPPEHLPRLTERFYRVDRGRSRAAGGTGLGLAIVKHVLVRHGGRLEIQSSQGSEDHGSSFRAIFPAARVMSEQPKPQAVAA